MTLTPALPSRRTVLAAGVVGAAGAAIGVTGHPRLQPRPAAAAPGSTAGSVFAHGVASGDPLGTAVVLWTRVTPTATAVPGSGLGPAVVVTWQLATDRAFRTVVRTGRVTTTTAVDHTVKVDVTALRPYTEYFFRFTALGATSPTGRAQTAPDDGTVHALRLGLASCSNYTGGYFTPYRFLAQRTDLDLVLHLGDYLYEYGNDGDRYGPDSLRGVRDHVPGVEMTTLQHYRQRHGCYKSDPDLQAAHAAHPWVVVFDDHEVTNDTYDTGAQNHSPDEGDFAVRRADAYRAYLEWMPIRLPSQAGAAGVRFWRRFSFGPLADLSVIETRQNRSEQVAGAAGGLLGYDSPEINDPARVLMEPEQTAWLTSGLQDPSRQWHLIGNQTVFTRVAAGRDLPGRDLLLDAGIPVQGAVFNTDQWDGYGDDQLEVLQAMASAPSDVVVLTGDIHSSWANDVPLDSGSYVPGPLSNSVAVEFVVPSVTSDGFAEILGGAGPAAAATTALQSTNPHIRFLDGIGHGYAVLDVTPEAVQTDFWWVSDREDPQATQTLGASWRSLAWTRSVVEAPGPIGERSDQPRRAVGARTGSAGVSAGGSAAGSAAGSAGAPAAPATALPRELPSTGLGAAALAGAALLGASAVAAAATRAPTPAP